MKQIWPALKIFLILTLLTGIVYPLVVTGIAQMFFPRQAQGNLVSVGGKVVGSSLIGQKFTDPRYFQPRPSAMDYNPLPSGGSNLGPTSAQLKAQVKQLRDSLAVINGKSREEVPPDLLFASGSGLDPHISPEAAYFQIDRIARVRWGGLAGLQMLHKLVAAHIEKPDLNILGEPRVNVLLLNIALDSLCAPVPSPSFPMMELQHEPR
jgi:potassium-transporting ATPase KdpC subunit